MVYISYNYILMDTERRERDRKRQKEQRPELMTLVKNKKKFVTVKKDVLKIFKLNSIQVS